MEFSPPVVASQIKGHRACGHGVVQHRNAAELAQQEIRVGDNLPGAFENPRRQDAQQQHFGQGVERVRPHAGAPEHLKLAEQLGTLPRLRRRAVIHAQQCGVQRAKLAVHGNDGVALHRDAQGARVACPAGGRHLAQGFLGQGPDLLGVLLRLARRVADHPVFAKGAGLHPAVRVENDRLAAGGADVQADQRHGWGLVVRGSRFAVSGSGTPGVGTGAAGAKQTSSCSRRRRVSNVSGTDSRSS